MVTKVVPVDLGEIITAGDDYSLVFTLTKDGATYDITGATITCTIREVGGTTDLITAHTVAITTALTGIATMTLLDTETALFVQPSAAGHLQTVQHIAHLRPVGNQRLSPCLE